MQTWSRFGVRIHLEGCGKSQCASLSSSYMARSPMAHKPLPLPPPQNIVLGRRQKPYLAMDVVVSTMEADEATANTSPVGQDIAPTAGSKCIISAGCETKLKVPKKVLTKEEKLVRPRSDGTGAPMHGQGKHNNPSMPPRGWPCRSSWIWRPKQTPM
jgi:hypothetical protein